MFHGIMEEKTTTWLTDELFDLVDNDVADFAFEQGEKYMREQEDTGLSDFGGCRNRLPIADHDLPHLRKCIFEMYVLFSDCLLHGAFHLSDGDRQAR